MNGTEAAKQAVDVAHQFLESTMADVTQEVAHGEIPGTANPVGSSYAHVLVSEDMVVAGMLKGGPPLFASSWATRTGLSEPMPLPGPDWSKYGAWVKSVQVDLPALREYGQAVYSQTADYISSLSDADLDREVDLSAAGFGKVNVGFILSALVAGHAHMLNGEIAAAKGVLGGKGYQF